MKILALILSIVSDPSHGTSMTSPRRVHSDTNITTVEEAAASLKALRLSSTLSRDA